MNKKIKHFQNRVVSSTKSLLNRNRLNQNIGILQLEKGNLEANLREKDSIINSKRNFLAERYLKGSGIEIGAAQLPVKLPDIAKVLYVDVFDENKLREIYPLYKKLDIVNIDVVDDGEKLSKFNNGSLDFIIANHFIEHCLDPIGTIINMYNKLRNEGVLYMAIPDKRYTFDKPRPLTSYDHLIKEHRDKSGQKFRLEHTIEYAKVKLGKQKNIDSKVKSKVKDIMESGYRIHYHVWTTKEMIEMLIRLNNDFGIDFEVEAMLKNHHEVIFIIRKKPAHRPIDYTPQM